MSVVGPTGVLLLDFYSGFQLYILRVLIFVFLLFISRFVFTWIVRYISCEPNIYLS